MAVLTDYRTIGLNISVYRHQMKLTQAQLAERAGISQQFLGRLECGKGIPSVNTLQALCDALGVTANDLLKHSAVHDPNPPCRLREEHTVFCQTLTDQLFPEQEAGFISIELLPEFDIELPDEADF